MQRSVNCNPLHTRGEEFLLGIDGDDVRTQRTDATIGTERNPGNQAGLVFVKSLEGRDQAFATQVFAAKEFCRRAWSRSCSFRRGSGFRKV